MTTSAATAYAKNHAAEHPRSFGVDPKETLMSEHDYQRGRRGGPANVSISDWERWKDWKAGHDEWEREQEDGDFERVLRTGDQNLINAEMRRRYEEGERKLAALDRQHKEHLEREQKRKQDASTCWIATAY